MDELGNQIVPRGNQPGAADRMRELLARTARDHAASQGSNAVALEDIRQRAEGLAAAITVLTEMVATLGTRLERLGERHDDQYDRLTSLEETLLILAEALLSPQALSEPQGRGPEGSGGHLSEPPWSGPEANGRQGNCI